jgi:hypothetical protein
MAQDMSCLVSTLRNTSGGTRKFGFIPPHGIELANAEEVSVVGNILEAVGRGDRGSGNRHRQAFLDALEADDIELVSTPSPVLEGTGGVPHVLMLNGANAVVVEDPCWESTAGAWPA